MAMVSANVAMGQAKERYLTDALFHAQVTTAAEVVLVERESSLVNHFTRNRLTEAIAIESAAIALHLFERVTEATAPSRALSEETTSDA